MKEIRDKLSGLIAAYAFQLDGYQQILDFGAAEEELINQRKFADVIRLLQEKEELMTAISAKEEDISELQAFFRRLYGLPEFSIPKLQEKASVHYAPQFSQLEDVVGRLVAVLEKLEVQEREHEARLREYTAAFKAQPVRTLGPKQANRVYTRAVKQGKPTDQPRKKQK